MRTELRHNIREARHVEKPCVDYAEAQGWMQTKVGIDGWPDRLFVRAGRYVWWEFKATEELGLAPKQKQRVKELRAQGCEVYWGASIKRFRRIMH